MCMQIAHVNTVLYILLTSAHRVPLYQQYHLILQLLHTNAVYTVINNYTVTLYGEIGIGLFLDWPSYNNRASGFVHVHL